MEGILKIGKPGSRGAVLAVMGLLSMGAGLLGFPQYVFPAECITGEIHNYITM